MDIKIIDLRFLSCGKPLCAFVDIQIGGWVVREWRVIKESGKRPRVSPPQTSWKGPDGRIQYKTIITFPDEMKGQIDFAILKAFTEGMEKSKGENSL